MYVYMYNVYVCIYIYIYMHIYMCVYIYIYIYVRTHNIVERHPASWRVVTCPFFNRRAQPAVFNER